MKISLPSLLSYAGALLPLALPAQIVLDGTMGHSAALTGPNFKITADLGSLSGVNLFHSFSSFNLAKGDVASFSGPASVQNVLARVTGGNVSSVDGTIQCTIPGASFFLINPAGVLFGPDASLDIRGSFTVTTADYLKFADGAKFNALKPSDSVLTTAAPAAFGFLKPKPQPIAMNNATLSVGAGQGMSIVGGNILLDGAALSAPDGAINLTSVQSKSEGSATPDLKSFAKGGDIDLTGGARVDVSGQQGGQITVRGGNLAMDANSLIQAQTQGALDGRGIDVALHGELDMTANSSISTHTTGTGKAADISVTANSISLTDGATLIASTDGPGNSGQVAVSANSVTIDGSASFGSSGIFSQSSAAATGSAADITVKATGQLALQDGGEISASTLGTGSAGEVKVTAGSLVMKGNDNAPFTAISSDSGSQGQGGPAGTVTVNIDKSVSISGNAAITSDTWSTGNAGSVTVSAGSLTINSGIGETTFTGISSESTASATGDAGSIAIAVKGQLALQDGGGISSSTFGVGSAGGVRVIAGSLVMKGSDNASGPLIVSDSAGDRGGGPAGTVTVNIDKSASISANAEIGSTTFGTGKAGKVSVSAGSLTIDGVGETVPTGILSESTGNTTGDAGAIAIAVKGQLALQDGGAISSSTAGVGSAGEVNVTAGSLVMKGNNDAQDTLIGSDSTSRGRGGPAGTVIVNIDKSVSISGNAAISADTFGTGKGGSVTVSAGSLTINSGVGETAFTGISTDSNPGATGDAGSVAVAVKGQVELQDGGEISSNTKGTGKAGEVTVSAGALTLNGLGETTVTGILSESTGNATGEAGSVAIAVKGQLALQDGAEISSSTHGVGSAGGVKVIAGSLLMEGHDNDHVTYLGSDSGSHGQGGPAGTVTAIIDNSVSISGNAEIGSSTFGTGKAGEVSVSAGSLTINGGVGETSFTGISSQSAAGAAGDGGSVAVAVKGQIVMQDGAGISSSTSGVGSAGGVKVTAGSLVMKGNGNAPVTAIGSDSRSHGQSGPAGTVVLNIDDSVSISGHAVIDSNTSGTGKAGEVTVSAGELTINGGVGETTFTGISTMSNAGASGDAGSVSVAVRGRLALEDGGEVSSSTSGAGSAGEVAVFAGSLSVKAFVGETTFTGISSQSNPDATGDAGSISVAVKGQVALHEGGEISTSTWGVGSAGGVKVIAGSLVMKGDDNAPLTAIGSDSSSRGQGGPAGDVTVNIDKSVSISGNAEIESNTSGTGKAGTVSVSAGSLSLNGFIGEKLFTGILSESNLGTTGDAGSVSVAVNGRLALQDGGAISSSTLGFGNGGQVNVNAGSIVINGDGANNKFITGIAAGASAGAAGDAGTVTVKASSVVVTGHGAEITSQATGFGHGGDVSVTGSKLIQIDGGGSVTAEASSSSPSDSGKILVSAGNVQMGGGTINSEANGGNAGRVQVNSSGTLSLYQSQILAGSHQQNGGIIDVSAPFLALNQSSINGNAYHTGGTIDISTPNFVESTRSSVTATSQTGNPGKVEISSPQLTLSGNLVALSLPGLSAEAYLPAQCGKSLGGDVSSFIVLGHDGLPLEPGGWVTSFPEEQKDKGRQHPDSQEK